jgi:hypothetical protein
LGPIRAGRQPGPSSVHTEQRLKNRWGKRDPCGLRILKIGTRGSASHSKLKPSRGSCVTPSGEGLSVFLAILAAGVLSYPLDGLARESKQRSAFQRANPCPSTGKARGACPGYVVDHVRPLCAAGPDLPSNMQWQQPRQRRRRTGWRLRNARSVNLVALRIR